MKVLYVATEVSPFIKVGGLGDVAGSLPKELFSRGVDIRVAVPRFVKVHIKDGSLISEYDNGEKIRSVMKESEFFVDFEWKREKVTVYKSHLPGSGVNVYFLDNPNYLSSEGDHYAGEHKKRIARFLFFSKAIVSWMNRTHWHPDIIHINDWHPATVATILKKTPNLCPECRKSKIVLSIHNHASNEFPRIGSMRYLLSYPVSDFPEVVVRKNGKVNLLLNGVKNSDMINAVSPTYARELVHRGFCGKELADAFFEKDEQGELTGILNGLDLTVFDPEKDKKLVKNYSLEDWKEGKAENKRTVQKKVGLRVDPDVPLLGFVARFTHQKGLDLLMKSLKEVKDSFQLVILGTGSREIEDDVTKFMEKHRGEYTAILKFDLDLAPLIYAGADMFLVPSRFEPCGLTQMIAMRYGSIPIVRKTGGLADTVTEGENGFVFSEFRSRSLTRAILRGCKAFQDKKGWARMVGRAMKEDFSWGKSAEKYKLMYQNVLR